LDNDIAIQTVQLHQERLPIGLLAGDQRAARAAEQVQDVLPLFGGILNRPHRQFHRFLRQMDHALRIDLFYMPEIGGIVGAVEFMTSAFLPAIKANFKRPHKILPCQNRVLLIPHNSLGKVQSGLLERLGVVAEIGVSAPDIKRAAGNQYACHVVEPGVEHLIEIFIGYEIILQGAVLGSHLLAGLFGIADAACLIKTLVMQLGFFVGKG